MPAEQLDAVEPLKTSTPADEAAPVGAGPPLSICCTSQPVNTINLLMHGLQEALIRAGVPAIRRERSRLGQAVASAVSRAKIMRPIGRRRRAMVGFVAWGSDSAVFPDAFWNELAPWIFDCWGPQFPRWEALLRRHRVRDAFFSARQAASHFERVIPGLRTHWLPEATEPRWLHPEKPLIERGTRVLEMGRSFARVHDAITEPLAARGVRHVYQRPGGPFLFEGVDGLYRGIGDTAVMICYPKSTTNPEGAGGIETATQRYFESIGSRCIIAGECPAELRDLFGFDPVIALPAGGEAEALLEIVNNLGSYQAHVDRAYARLLEVGTFEARARELLETWARVRGDRP